jgi:hypothetical protein
MLLVLMLMLTVGQLVECLGGETEVLGEKSVPVLISPPQIPHDLTQAQTQAGMVGSEELTA